MTRLHPTLTCAFCLLPWLFIAGCGGGSDSGTDLPGTDVFDNGGPTDQGPGVDAVEDPGQDLSGRDVPEDVLPDAEPDSTRDTGTDEGPVCEDPDGDGYGPNCEAGPDCAPNDPLRHTILAVYVDADYDGFGAGEVSDLCTGEIPPPGWSLNDLDCNDADPTTYPGAQEIPDDGVANACGGDDLKAATADGVFVAPGAPIDAAGTREAPVGSITAALALAAGKNPAHVFVAEGNYDDSLAIASNVAIHGGYDAATWTRALRTSRLTATGPIAVTIDNARVLITQMQIWGAQDGGDPVQNPEATAISIQKSDVTLVRSQVSGGYLEAAAGDDDSPSRTGIVVDDSRVTLIRTDTFSGVLNLTTNGGTDVFRNARAEGLRMNSGRLKILGGKVYAGGYTEVRNARGSAYAGVRATALYLIGGEARLVGVEIDGSAEARTKDTDNLGTEVRSETSSHMIGVRVGAGARAWILNSMLSGGFVRSSAEVWAAGTVAEPITGDCVADTYSTPLMVQDGTVELLHCNLWVDEWALAETDVQVDSGTVATSETSLVTLANIEDQGRARIWSSTGYSSVAAPGSAFFRLGFQGDLALVGNVFWDYGEDVCRLFQGDECRVAADRPLDDCNQSSECTASNNRTEDPLWSPSFWKVTAASPLRDQAPDPASYGMGAPTDIDGKARPQGSGYDIGAVEFDPVL